MFSRVGYTLLITGLVLKYLDTIWGRAIIGAWNLKYNPLDTLCQSTVCFKLRETGTLGLLSRVTVCRYAGIAVVKEPTNLERYWYGTFYCGWNAMMAPAQSLGL
jgi:hypothetical protein